MDESVVRIDRMRIEDGVNMELEREVVKRNYIDKESVEEK